MKTTLFSLHLILESYVDFTHQRKVNSLHNIKTKWHLSAQLKSTYVPYELI